MEAFLLRVWVPAEPEPDEAEALRLKGLLTHVRSGRESRFSGAEQLVARIVEQLSEGQAESSSPATRSSPAPRQAKP
jgi:hypothetical protein